MNLEHGATGYRTLFISDVHLGQRASQAERARIAREMHDVVAHSVTLLVVHTEAMRARAAELPPWAREQADAMAADGRRAADEMRQLLGVLQTAAEAPLKSPD